MAQRLDLYAILKLYADKRHSPYIDVKAFLAFFEKYVNHVSRDQPEWRGWAADVMAKFYDNLAPLVEARKCEVLEDKRRILMLDFYADRLNPTYTDIDKAASLPFPDEASLGLVLPDEECRILKIGEDLAGYMKKPQTTVMPVIKLVFPDKIPSALVLATAIPRPLLDAALLKIRNFLRTQNNKSFFQRRLLPQMQGKENLFKDTLNMVEIRPLDCILQIQSATDFTGYFWTSFCFAVRTELKKKEDFLSIDIAALQAVYVIDAFASIFKEGMLAKRQREQALKALEAAMDQPPYLYTINEILKFTDSSGNPLLGQYTEEDLQNYINSSSTAATTEGLANLLIYRDKKGERVFINKHKVFPLCARLSGEARNQVKKAVGLRWSRLLRNFEKEPAMTNDAEFNKLLFQYTSQLVPNLVSLLRDKKTFLVQCEIERPQKGIPLTARFYTPDGTLFPMGTLLMINRRDLLTDTRILLPVWYSIPVLSTLFAFFKHLFGNGKKGAPAERSAEATSRSGREKARSQEQTMKAVSTQILQKLPSGGRTLETSLAALEKKWHTLLEGKAKQQLIIDIKALIRDRLRRVLRLKMNQKISAQTIEELAGSIYAEAPALQQLGDKESITTYIKLYCAKLLLTIKL
ncbi:MAG: hypothetical protein LBE17_06200 [Treponema sp.]|jgi:hypothetical protein|nr:hypothetical protein [Treponema sp.]